MVEAAYPPACIRALLQRAVLLAPRRYRLPPLPANLAAAQAAAPQSALAFALEAARNACLQGSEPAADVRELFIHALAAVIQASLRPDAGDPAFQAQVLRAGTPEVQEYAALHTQSAADQRAVRVAVNAFAHPGKLARLGSDAAPNGALSELYRQAEAGAWVDLARAAAQLQQDASTVEDVRAALAALIAQPGLERLRRGSFLEQTGDVRRYRALCERRGPLAGSGAAADHGRAAARLGVLAEDATVQAFSTLAELLNRYAGGTWHCRAVQGLRTPRGFPGAAAHAKGEWDAALVCAAPVPSAAAAVVLLAEVKASPAAATADFPRLRRGLQRLALARPDAVHVFGCKCGELPLSGESLAQLQPPPQGLPPQVIYCCSALADEQPPLLAASAKALLLAESASLDFARRLAGGEAATPAALSPVWRGLTRASRLRAALEQYETARCVREAMLHPQDLVSAVAAEVGRCH
jgi:hypothetical protein